jgi:NRPS condensation-like uncharacterized protein
VIVQKTDRAEDQPDVLRELFADLPRDLPVPSSDRWQHHALLIGDNHIRLCLRFEHPLDAARLERAVLLSIRIAPVIVYRYVDRFWRPRWRRVDRLDHRALFDVFAAQYPQQAEARIRQFIESRHPPGEPPQMRVRLIREPGVDHLCLSISHLLGDAGALKHYAYRLAQIYRRLQRDPQYLPPCEVHKGRRYRDINPGWLTLKTLRALLQPAKILPPVSSTFPYEVAAAGEDRFTYRCLRTGPSRFREIQRLARTHDATLNDVVLTALFRAYHQMVPLGEGQPAVMLLTSDLRTLLNDPVALPICNYSHLLAVVAGLELDLPFETLLARVRDDSRQQKAQRGSQPSMFHWQRELNLRSNASARKYFHRSFSEMLAQPLPSQSNLGEIDAEALDFGEPQVTDAYMVSVFLKSPLFQHVCCSFRQRLTFSVGFHDTAMNRVLVRELLERFERELPGAGHDLLDTPEVSK